ncbi:MAG: arginine repressor [Clostridia bacterium]|nr:arginine repressor [Clostridia bacterium]
MKKNRHEKIIEIVDKYDIETQDELIEQLRKLGYEVTQATVSRDIRELKLTKVMSNTGSYRYELPKSTEALGNFKFNHALAESITSVDYAMHTVIIKTFPGMAQAVAVGIDNLKLPVILGCVAGDDTIIVVSRNADAAADLNTKIKEIIRGQ